MSFNLPQHRYDLLWLVPLDWHDPLSSKWILYQLGFRAEVFDLFNHPNYQQNVVDNVQYTANGPNPNPNNSTDQLWTADPNPFFGQPGAIVPKFGSRSFQFSTRFTF